jgi:hypothetical protein
MCGITDQLVLVIKVASWSKFFPEKQGLAQKKRPAILYVSSFWQPTSRSGW